MLRDTELAASLANIFVGSPLFWSHWKCHCSFSCSFFVGCWHSKRYCTFLREVVVSRHYSPPGPTWFGKSFWTVSPSIAIWRVTAGLESFFPSFLYHSLLSFSPELFSFVFLYFPELPHSTSCSCLSVRESRTETLILYMIMEVRKCCSTVWTVTSSSLYLDISCCHMLLKCRKEKVWWEKIVTFLQIMQFLHSMTYQNIIMLELINTRVVHVLLPWI